MNIFLVNPADSSRCDRYQSICQHRCLVVVIVTVTPISRASKLHHISATSVITSHHILFSLVRLEENYSVDVNSDEEGVAYVFGMHKESVKEACMLIKVTH